MNFPSNKAFEPHSSENQPELLNNLEAPEELITHAASSGKMNQYTSDIRVGELLVRAGVIGEDELRSAVQTAQDENLHLGQVFVKNGILTNEQLRAAIDAQTALKDKQCDARTGFRALRTALKSKNTFEMSLSEVKRTASAGGPSNRLGGFLLEAKLITWEQFQNALTESLQSGLPLGRCLILNGALPASTLELALELQVRVRDEVLGREEAVTLLKGDIDKNQQMLVAKEEPNAGREARKHTVRVGDLLVKSGAVSDHEVLEAQESAVANGQRIGQALLSRGLVQHATLEAALAVQQMVDNSFITEEQAYLCLARVHSMRSPLSQAMVDLGLVTRRRFKTLGDVVNESQENSTTTLEQDLQKTIGEKQRINVGLNPQFTNTFDERSEYLIALSNAYETLADVALDRGDYLEAEANFRTTISLKCAVHGSGSVEIIDDILSLAASLCFQGRMKEGENFLLKAIGIVEASEPYRSDKAALCFSGLGRVYLQLGRFAEAEPLIARSIAISKMVTGNEIMSRQLIETLKDYARLLVRTERPKEAELVYAEARHAATLSV